MYDLLDSAKATIQQAENIPLLGWYMRRKFNTAQKMLPPRDVLAMYIQDEIIHDRREANRIYGSKEPEVLEAEIIE